MFDAKQFRLFSRTRCMFQKVKFLKILHQIMKSVNKILTRSKICFEKILVFRTDFDSVWNKQQYRSKLMRFSQCSSSECFLIKERWSSLFRNRIATNKVRQNQCDSIDVKSHMYRESKSRQIVCCRLIAVTKSSSVNHEWVEYYFWLYYC